MRARTIKRRALFLLPLFCMISCPDLYAQEGPTSLGQPNISSSDIALRLDKCRAQLRDIEKLRGTAQKLGHIELFEGLFSHAQRILDQIASNSGSSEIYLLLGECQGVLESLEFSLNLSKYGKRKTHFGKGPRLLPSTPTKRQVATHATVPDPIPVFKKTDNINDLSDDKNTIIHIKTVPEKHEKGSYVKSAPFSGRRSPSHPTNDLNEALH